jgi:hypothetical protein
MPFHFDPAQLGERAATHHDEYVGATPFPHIALDDFLPEAVLGDVLAEFPSARDEGWLRFESENEVKLGSQADTPIGETTRLLLQEFNSAAFIEFLEQLTGIQGLVPDPYFEGGGMHQIVRGGHLNVHVDFNRHPRTGLARRLNALIYLNRDWKDEYGGKLELWSADQQRCERRIAPLFNRLVVFSTTETSYHGHPEPLACPEDTSRKSLALYYYSLAPADRNGAESEHNTVWKAPPEPRAKSVVRSVTPPILLDAARNMRRRARSGSAHSG